MFVVTHFCPGLIFAGKVKPGLSRKGLHLDRRQANIRQMWKGFRDTNALAYYGTEIITTVKSYVEQAASSWQIFSKQF